MASRGLSEEVKLFSADLQDYLAVPYDNVMGGLGFIRAPSEHCLFPGLAPIFLAVIGLFIVPPRHDPARVGLQPGPKSWFGLYISRSQGFYLGLAACAFVLSLGPTLRAFGRPTGITLPYMFLYKYCPGLDSIRAVSRFGILVLLALAVLAGDGVARIVDGVVLGRASAWSRVALTGVITVMVMSEYASFPITTEPIEAGPRAPEVYRWLAHQEAGGAVIELPFGSDWLSNARYEYFSAYHWRPIVNGNSGFYPTLYSEMMSILAQLPAGDSVGLLRALGIDLIIVHEDGYRPEVYRELQSRMAENPELVAVQNFGKDHVYRVRRRAGSGGQTGELGTEAELSGSTRMLISRIPRTHRATATPPSSRPRSRPSFSWDAVLRAPGDRVFWPGRAPVGSGSRLSAPRP